MPYFRYEASTENGQLLTGRIEALDAKTARQQLRLQGLTPLAVEADAVKQTSLHTANRTHSQTATLSKHEMALLLQQLSALITAKLPISEALNVLLAQAEKPKTKHHIQVLLNDIAAGLPLSQAIQAQPKTYPSWISATLSAGESTGKLDTLLEELAKTIQQQHNLQQRIVAALAYPCIVAFISFVVVMGLMAYVVPQVVAVFQDQQQSLPILTQIVMATSQFIQHWSLWCIVGISFVCFMFKRMLKNPNVKQQWHRSLLNTPWLGPLLLQAETIKLASTLAVLHQSGVPIINGLQAAQHTLRNTHLAQALQTATQKVNAGQSLSVALQDTQQFPPLLNHLIASGESTGQLHEMLNKAAQLHRTQLERKLLWFTSLMEPIMIMVMGGIVLMIVLAVMMPIIEINQWVGS